MSEKSNELIYELLKEVKIDLKEINSEVNNVKITQNECKVLHHENKEKLHEIHEEVQKVKEENIIQSKDIESNKESLVEHMDNNVQLKKLIDLNERRFKAEVDELKKPAIARSYIIKIAAGLGTIAGAAYGIYRLYLLF